ncbi:hypothetical protein [Comamonas antarctica]|uniref:hypothetical protein n=1 Tax=Comamonas antarctica TaxID=2743470 RepID=UPI0028E31237|nr:hypothetical protein [Comamonas antarctica]
MKKARTLNPIAQMPAPERCSVCTTPARCQTAAWGTRGKNCAGKDDGPDICDCLDRCGDDPRIASGQASPCQHYLDRRARAAEETANQRQLEEDAASWRAQKKSMNASHVTAISIYVMVDGQLCLAPISPDGAAMFIRMLPAFQPGQPEAAKLVAMPAAVAKHVEAAGRALGECVDSQRARRRGGG